MPDVIKTSKINEPRLMKKDEPVQQMDEFSPEKRNGDSLRLDDSKDG
jgi:hypothetical protein